MRAGYDRQANQGEADVLSGTWARPGASPLKSSLTPGQHPIPQPADIYTPGQRQRRDATIWTPVQGVLAALQFVVFLISLALVIRFILSGQGFFAASMSVCLKTAVLLTIMVTGSLWEKAVFGQYLFAPSFFWEDVVSFVVIALHLLYVAAFVFDLASAQAQMFIALAAYVAYIINAGQFLWKFRQARIGSKAGVAALAHGHANGAIASSSASRRKVTP